MVDTAYVRSLSTGKTKLSIMSSLPAVPESATLVEFQAGIDAGCRIVQSDFALGASDDNTVNEPALCDVVSADVPTTAKYDGSVSVFRYFNPVTGKAETGTGGDVGDAVFQAMKLQGTTLFIARRDSMKLSTDPWEDGDEYELFEVITGTPQEGGQEGYLKKTVKLYVQRAWSGTVGGATAPAWQASHTYAVGDQVTGGGHIYQATVGGTSGTTQPTWPASGTVTDNAVTWTFVS